MSRLRSHTNSESPVPNPQGVGRSSYIDPATLMRIRSLELRAKVVVQGFLSGMHRSPYHGFSVEFTEYREYSPGDDLRYLDWKLFARSDRYYLKRFEDETNLRCWLLVDLSRSMGYTSGEFDKATYARTAAATIAYFLSLQRDAVGLVTFDAGLGEFVPPRFRPGHLHRLMMCLDKAPAGRGTDLSAPLDQVTRTARKRGMVVLLSDFLAPVASMEKQLCHLRTQGHEVVVMRILDPAEVDFPFRQAAMFHDIETGRELYVDPELVAATYRQRFQAHAAELLAACGRLGITLYDVTTDRPLELSLFDFLSQRMRRGKMVGRHRGPGSTQIRSGGG